MDPMVRLARVRSKSGRFEENYEVQEGDVLGEGMSGNVIVGTNKKTGVTRFQHQVDQNWRELFVNLW